MVKRNAEKLRSPYYKVADIGLEIDLYLLRDVSYIETVNESFTEFSISSNKSNHHVPVAHSFAHLCCMTDCDPYVFTSTSIRFCIDDADGYNSPPLEAVLSNAQRRRTVQRQ